MRILLLTNVVPYPPRGGVHLRVYNLLTRIARKHEVTLGCHSWGEEGRENAAWLNRHCFPTVEAPMSVGNWRHIVPALGNALRGVPPEMAQYQLPGLRALLRRERFDLVQVEETWLAPYIDSIPRAWPTRTVITFHNIHAVQTQRMAEIEPVAWRRAWLSTNARFMQRYEPRIATRFDRSITVSPVDRQLLLASAPHLHVEMLPNGVDTAQLTPLPPPSATQTAPPAILFTGTLSYLPCADAAIWLVSVILPLLRRHVPDVEVWIVGRLATPAVEALAGERVFVTGEVPDTVPYYRRSTVAVAPLRAGGGSRLKILEAMALGRPVVSTTIGAEGLDLRAGEHLLLADSAEAFAEAIARVLRDQALARTLAENARRFVCEHHDWDAIAAAQLDLYDQFRP